MIPNLVPVNSGGRKWTNAGKGPLAATVGRAGISDNLVTPGVLRSSDALIRLYGDW